MASSAITVSFVKTHSATTQRPTQREPDGGKSAKILWSCVAVVFPSTRRWLRKPLGFSLLWQKPKVRHSSGMIGRYASYILRVGFMPAAVSSGVDRP